MITLSGHTNGVSCVAAAGDGHVLTGSWDKTVKVWRGDELVRTIEAHSHNVWERAKKFPEFKYVFNENGRDVLNKQNPESTKKTLGYLASMLE